MNAQQETVSTATEERKHKKNRSAPVWAVLVIIVFLFLLSTVVLGSQLYKLATRDQYTVNLGLGELDGSIELFRIEYANECGQITVRGLNADNVVAPGTTVSYDLRLYNNDDVMIDFTMTPIVEFLTDDAIPVEFKIMDDYGNYILGDENTWGSAQDMNELCHKGSIHPGEVFTYHVSWQWVFEVSDDQDRYDTYLGNQDGQVLPGLRVGIETEAAANPMPVKSNIHILHLLGEGFGCCWCCWLVWFLLLVCLLLVIWIWRLCRRNNRQAQTLDEYEEVLQKHGLLVNGELIDHEKAIH